MIRFEHLGVYGIIEALRGMRNPQESWSKGDSYKTWTVDGDAAFHIGSNDLKLAQQLSKAGNDHAKYLRQIFVTVDIIAPFYFWRELSTYKISTVANSTSMMHKLGSRLLTEDDFSMEDVKQDRKERILKEVNECIQEWWNSGKRKPSQEWRQMQEIIPSSFVYRRTWSANYQVLKTIAHSDRKHHKLTEWHEFIKFFVDNAPYFKELCIDPITGVKK